MLTEITRLVQCGNKCKYVVLVWLVFPRHWFTSTVMLSMNIFKLQCTHTISSQIWVSLQVTLHISVLCKWAKIYVFMYVIVYNTLDLSNKNAFGYLLWSYHIFLGKRSTSMPPHKTQLYKWKDNGSDQYILVLRECCVKYNSMQLLMYDISSNLLKEKLHTIVIL